MTTTIPIPRGHKKRLKSFDSLSEINRWGSDVDARIDEIIQSLSSTQRAIREITRTTGAASLGLHATTHRPGSGSDPLATAAPTSILGGTSSNSVGVGTSFARNDHSHDVATAVPAILYGTTALEGVSNSLLRIDATLKHPAALMSPTSSSLLTLSDDATDQTLTGSLGLLKIVPGSGVDINFPNSTAASLVIRPNTTTAASTVVFVQGRPVAGTRTLMAPVWFGAAASDVFSAQTFRCWDAQFSSFIPGQITNCVFVGHDISVMTIVPSAGSGAGNKAYGFRANNLTISNANATWDEIATAYFPGPDRVISAVTATLTAGAIVEPAVVGGTEQVGLLVRQRAAEQVATTRYGIKVDAQNSGTNRYAFYGASDTLYHGGRVQHTGVQFGIYGATPTVQFGTTGTASGFAAGTSTTVTADSTFTGNTGSLAYTIGDCIRALKLIGALAT